MGNKFFQNLTSLVVCLFLLTGCPKKKTEYVDNKIGLAPYALLHNNFPCQDFLQSIEHLPYIHISILWNTFGQNLSCLGEVLKKPNTKSLQIHLVNETCMRANRCGPYEIFKGEMSSSKFNTYMERNEGWVIEEIVEYSKPVADLLKANKRPDLAFYISPGLESNLSDRAAINFIAAVKPLFSEIAEIVWNPVRGSNLNGAQYLELHPTDSNLNPPCFFNLDGTSITFPGVKTTYHQNKSYTDIPGILNKYQHCKMRYLWHNAYNCGLKSDAFVDPRQRVCNNWDGVFKKVASLVPVAEGNSKPTTSVGTTSTVPPISYSNPKCSGVMGADGSGGFLWKPVSESNKNLVILFPGKFKEQFKNVYVTRKDGRKDPLRFAGWKNPENNGDNRQHWRASRPGSSYKDYGLVEAMDSRQICKWKIGKAQDRTD